MIFRPGGKISTELLRKPFVKAVVDIERNIIFVGCELHIDGAQELEKDGSVWEHLWGYNIFPDGKIECMSLINIRPHRGNRSMFIELEDIREKVEEIAKKFL